MPLVDPESSGRYVKEHSSADRAFFRLHGQPKVWSLDTREAMSVHYYMDNALFKDRGDLLAQPVKATLRRRGFLPVTIEMPLSQILKF